MRLTRKEKKFINILFILWLFLAVEYSAHAFDPVVPQERINEIIQIGSITPSQFEELDSATIESILERKDVQSIFKNHFELLGMYGETSAGLLLRSPEDWERFGDEVTLNGTVFRRVYDYWYQEKWKNQQELLTGDEEKMDAFFETHFSSEEEHRLTDGRLMGTDLNWNTFAYERGLPITAGILLLMYQAWWRKRKEGELDDWGGLETIYAEKFETNHQNYGDFYMAVRNDDRVYGYTDWYPRAWTFWEKANAQLQETLNFKKGAKDIVSTVNNYVSNRKNKQQKSFESALQEVLNKLSPEEIESIGNGTFDTSSWPELFEDVDYIHSINEIFPFQSPPQPPSSETVQKTVEDFYQQYEPLFQEEESLKYWEKALLVAKALFDQTIGEQKEHCENQVKIIEAEIEKGIQKIAELENEIDPLKNTIVSHVEVYSDEFESKFDTLIQQLDEEHKAHIAKIRAEWAPLIASSDYWESERGCTNMEGSIAYYEKQYQETRTQIKKYRSGKFFRDIACTRQLNKEKRDKFNDQQKQNREAYREKREKDPARKRVIQYLMGLEDAGNTPFFQAQKSTLLHLDVLEEEIQSLEDILTTQSPYKAEIERIETFLVAPNHYSFEEYVEKYNIQNSTWIMKDDWLRGRDRIGRGTRYWREKYAEYANTLMRDFSPYDERAIETLRNLAQKAHTEKIESYAGWEQFYKEHPLAHEARHNASRTQLSALQQNEEERTQLFGEQIETLEARVHDQSMSAFASAQWLGKTPEEREKDSLTEIILEAEINSSVAKNLAPVDSATLLQHFSDVRESQSIAQQSYLNIIVNQQQKDPLTLDVDTLLAPIISRMHYNETPAGVAEKSEYFDAIVGTTESEVIIPPPVIYQKNENGTYTPLNRETGEIIPEPTPEIPIEIFTQTEEVEPMTEEVVAEKKVEILNIGQVEEFQAQTQISLRKLLSVGSPLKFGLGVLDGVKSEIKGILSLLNPLTWIEILKVATKMHQLKQQFLLSALTDPLGMIEHLKTELPEIAIEGNTAMNEALTKLEEQIANADDRQKGAIVAATILSFIPLGKLGKASKLTRWVDDIAVALNKFVPQPKLAGMTVGGKTVIMDDVVRAGGKVINYKKIDDVIEETLKNRNIKHYNSSFSVNYDEALELGERFLGGKGNYSELGSSGSGVFRSKDGLRQFRMDTPSLQGQHEPNLPHVHLEILDGSGRVVSNNHITLR